MTYNYTKKRSTMNKRKIYSSRKNKKPSFSMSLEDIEKIRLIQQCVNSPEVRKRDGMINREISLDKQRERNALYGYGFITDIKLRWRDPNFAKMMFKTIGKRPNNDELYLDSILQLNFCNEWKYVGDGKFWIEGKNPDFINCNGKKIVIEYNGYYTHTPEIDQIKTEHYLKYGFRTINLYPDDLKSELVLTSKIRLMIQK